MKKITSTVSILCAAACLAACTLCFTGCGDSGKPEGGSNEKPHNVIIMQAGDPEAVFSLTVTDGELNFWEAFYEQYPEGLGDTGLFYDAHLYTDEECRIKYLGGAADGTVLYYGRYIPGEYTGVVFHYQNEEYKIYREVGAMLCADDFTCSAYGYGEASDYIFYSDEEHTRQIDINNFEVVWGSAFIGIYVADAD